MEKILDFYRQKSAINTLFEHVDGAKSRIRLKGLSGSLPSVLGALFSMRCTDVVNLFIVSDKETAFYFMNDIEALLGEGEKELAQKQVLLFPTTYRKPYQTEDVDNANVLLRSEVVKRLGEGKHPIIITYPEALSEKVVSARTLKQNTISLKVGDELSVDFLMDVLMEYEFERVDFVVEPGQYAVRGGIVDVYSFANEHPFRIEFFGDNVESLRTFDTVSQLSVQLLDNITLIPNLENKEINRVETKVPLVEYLSEKDVIWVDNLMLTADVIEKGYCEAEQVYKTISTTIERQKPAELYTTANEFLKHILDLHIVEYGNTLFFNDAKIVPFDTTVQPTFNKHFEMLIQKLKDYTERNYKIYICVENVHQQKRLDKIFGQFKDSTGLMVEFLDISLSHGFVDDGNRVVCFTDHEIFERYHKYKVKDFSDAREALTLKELFELKPGDYVTHIDYGVGRFAGLEKVDNNGKQQEAIRLMYKDNDVLYISIHSLHKISRYVGKEGSAPTLNRLGSPSWQVLKQKTKQRVKDIAKDLIKLYAERKASKGFAFSADSYLQTELESSFIYEDTPDQYKATRDVKADMEMAVPMDRLVCGDVGFGKTEVAIRAAFKAVADSKQVAVLVPTTILALQHYNTFVDRLNGLPCNIEYINRFRTTKEKNRIYADLESGKIDILIGTHAITNSKVKFKDLGLLIIDEEQKFGVSVKEKLRQMKVNVDSLTLTATPIPRTLQFSLMGARDLSVINTPPTNRQPVQTELQTFSEEAVRDAIMHEMSRGGQVFFVSNRVENLLEMAGMVKRLVPDARVGVGHGQMEGAKLEEVLLDFVNGDTDVLVSTAIVENGLDIPNANTIIINNAQNFGLSALHQLRGRVGRSNKKSYCYLLVPSFNILTPEAQKRLKAIEEFSTIGSGFNIAMRDLDIRGAGNILGAEQSGFISEIGYDMYHKILNEAIDELKATEFRDLYADELKAKETTFVKECTIETDLEVLLPDDYVTNITERLVLYKELNELETDEQLDTYTANLTDRFGPLPVATKELVETIKLRRLAKDLGIEKLVLKRESMICYFVANQDSGFYKSPAFMNLIRFVQDNSKICHLKESKDKLSLVFASVRSIASATDILRRMAM
ncbi:MAG: transcription-repair coupling factor [Bacteroidales bacterium]|nr:transcription-repair coupling factor [Bacteroidales bacterium]